MKSAAMKRLTLIATLLFAATAAAADIEISDAWVRGTVAAQTATGAFMNIRSKSDLALVGVSTPGADAELHEMRLENGIMKMRAAPRVELSAGKTLSLKPGGYHIMITGLKKALQPGERLPITLTFEDAAKRKQQVEVAAEIKPLGESGGNADANPHEHHHMH